MAHPIGAGDAFPDVRLADHAGNERALSELVAGDPTIMHTYRGWWCPKEQAFVRRLVALQDEVVKLGKSLTRSDALVPRLGRRARADHAAP